MHFYARDTSHHLPTPGKIHGAAHKLSFLSSSFFQCKMLCGLQHCPLRPLLTFLLERAFQESAVHWIIHILILKPGTQHSLPLFLPLDYVGSIKCVFKSHIRGCGLETVGVILQKQPQDHHENDKGSITFSQQEGGRSWSLHKCHWRKHPPPPRPETVNIPLTL